MEKIEMHNIYNKGVYQENKGCSMSMNIDTYAERVFFEKCSVSNEQIKIFYEWQANKERYTHATDTTIYDFQNYSLHDSSHSRTIINAVEKFLGTYRIEKMSIGDLWLLLNAAYGHDIGMSIKNDEVLELWRENEEFHAHILNLSANPEYHLQEEANYYLQIHNILKHKEQMQNIRDGYRILEWTRDWPIHLKHNVMILTNEFIRKNHADRSRKFLEVFGEATQIKIAENRFYTTLGKVAYAHNEDFEYVMEKLEQETDGFALDKMHPQFIAAMLRLGDLLDMDNNRFDIMAIEHFGELPFTSSLHLKKHRDLTHLRITERKIEARIETDDIEVSEISLGWLDMIEKEISNITRNWNSIVPEELGGCTFKKSKLEVYLNGELCKLDLQKKFEVDKKKFMDLLIGDKLYDDPLVFIREYLQNAMDASKMMLNRKWHGDWNRCLFKEVQEAKREYTPFDLNPDYLNELGIEVELDILKEKRKKSWKYLQIIFRDRGIGMEESCFKALSVIGTGWRGRKKYEADLLQMPCWLCPTGGFGIGIQSGFMITDRIQIKTLGEQESKAWKMTLESPRNGGHISRIGDSTIKRVGTEVTLWIPLERYLDKVQEKSQDFNNGEYSQCAFFKKEDALAFVAKTIKQYIEKQIPNSLFPITILYNNGQKIVVEGEIYKLLKDGTEFNYDEKTKCLYRWEHRGEKENRNSLYLWNCKKKYYAKLTGYENSEKLGNEKQPDDCLCFRGIDVKYINGDGENKDLVAESIHAVVDLFEFEAENWLLVSRSGIQPFGQKEISEIGEEIFGLYLKLLKYSKEKTSFGDKRALAEGIVKLAPKWCEEDVQEVKNSGISIEVYQIQNRDDAESEYRKDIDAGDVFEFVNRNKMVLWDSKDEMVSYDVLRLENIFEDGILLQEKDQSLLDKVQRNILTGESGLIVLMGNDLYNDILERMDTEADKFSIIGKNFTEKVIACKTFYEEKKEEKELKKVIEVYLENFLNRNNNESGNNKQYDPGYIEISDMEEYDALPVRKIPYAEGEFLAEEYYKIHNIILMPIEGNHMGILFEKEVETNTGKKMDWDMFWNEIEKGEIWANILEWVSSHTRKEGVEKVDVFIL